MLAISQAEQAVLRLLQGAARTPEELLSSAVELMLLGLLSKATLSNLCTSVGLSGEPLEQLLLHTDTAVGRIAAGSGGGRVASLMRRP